MGPAALGALDAAVTDEGAEKCPGPPSSERAGPRNCRSGTRAWPGVHSAPSVHRRGPRGGCGSRSIRGQRGTRRRGTEAYGTRPLRRVLVPRAPPRPEPHHDHAPWPRASLSSAGGWGLGPRSMKREHPAPRAARGTAGAVGGAPHSPGAPSSPTKATAHATTSRSLVALSPAILAFRRSVPLSAERSLGACGGGGLPRASALLEASGPADSSQQQEPHRALGPHWAQQRTGPGGGPVGDAEATQQTRGRKPFLWPNWSRPPQDGGHPVTVLRSQF